MVPTSMVSGVDACMSCERGSLARACMLLFRPSLLGCLPMPMPAEPGSGEVRREPVSFPPVRQNSTLCRACNPVQSTHATACRKLPLSDQHRAHTPPVPPPFLPTARLRARLRRRGNRRSVLARVVLLRARRARRGVPSAVSMVLCGCLCVCVAGSP